MILKFRNLERIYSSFFIVVDCAATSLTYSSIIKALGGNYYEEK